jgi:hypothetical protein
MSSDVMSYSPNVLSKEEIQACLSVIKEGDAVNLKFAEKELPQAVVVAVKREGQNLVGVGAIKRKRPDYSSKIAKNSGFSFDQNMHELGYVAVKKSHQRQGLSHQITAKLLSTFQGRPIFATTSHEGMKRTLKTAGFIRQGTEWQGKTGNLLSLWIKDADSSK